MFSILKYTFVIFIIIKTCKVMALISSIPALCDWLLTDCWWEKVILVKSSSESVKKSEN